MGSDGERQMKLRLLAATHLLLCGPVPNRPADPWWRGLTACRRKESLEEWWSSEPLALYEFSTGWGRGDG